MDTPFPMSVELAEAVHIFAGPEGDSGDLPEIARIIDARVRPLVEALRYARVPLAEAPVIENYEGMAYRAVEKIDAALRAAGAE